MLSHGNLNERLDDGLSLKANAIAIINYLDDGIRFNHKQLKVVVELLNKALDEKNLPTTYFGNLTKWNKGVLDLRSKIKMLNNIYKDTYRIPSTLLINTMQEYKQSVKVQSHPVRIPLQHQETNHKIDLDYIHNYLHSMMYSIIQLTSELKASDYPELDNALEMLIKFLRNNLLAKNRKLFILKQQVKFYQSDIDVPIFYKDKLRSGIDFNRTILDLIRSKKELESNFNSVSQQREKLATQEKLLSKAHEELQQAGHEMLDSFNQISEIMNEEFKDNPQEAIKQVNREVSKIQKTHQAKWATLFKEPVSKLDSKQELPSLPLFESKLSS